MSFILDALKKSETDRQHKGSAEFANVPVSTPDDDPPRWLWVLGALLLLNIVVVAGLLMRPGPQSVAQAPAPQPAAAMSATIASESPAQAAPQQQFAAEIAAARQTPLPREEPVTVETSAPAQSRAPAPAALANEPANPLALPTAQEVIANGSLTLPALHVDVHVYSESSEDRFVFINMTKHKEGSVLAEGPRVQSITPEGVVLSQNGITFLLPRD